MPVEFIVYISCVRACGDICLFSWCTTGLYRALKIRLKDDIVDQGGVARGAGVPSVSPDGHCVPGAGALSRASAPGPGRGSRRSGPGAPLRALGPGI